MICGRCGSQREPEQFFGCGCCRWKWESGLAFSVLCSGHLWGVKIENRWWKFFWSTDCIRGGWGKDLGSYSGEWEHGEVYPKRMAIKTWINTEYIYMWKSERTTTTSIFISITYLNIILNRENGENPSIRVKTSFFPLSLSVFDILY